MTVGSDGAPSPEDRAEAGPPIDVTVVIPARNEAAAIDDCLAHVLAQDWPHDRLEVIVVDGDSDDGTGDRARALLGASDVASQVLVNHDGNTPSNLNRGLAAARGRYLCRVDARSFIPPDYVRRCVEVLDADPAVRVVGGRQVARAVTTDARAVGIARALNNRFAMGGARYRGLGGSGPVDTVYLGFFRTDELRSVGGWDLRFPTNQDFDLNRRMTVAGGLVWFIDGLEIGYRPRGALGDVLRQYHRFGTWKVRYWVVTGDAPRPRQVAILAAPPVAVVVGAALLVTGSSARRAVLLIAGAGGAAAVEHVGSGGPAGGLLARLWSVATMVCVSSGWSVGVWQEWFAGRRRSAARDS